ncbi:MAG: transposase, partial [Aliarcobacter sp.]
DISAGKIEGVNNRIKTLRRQGYGYPDDDYFFLKLFDASRKDYVRNPAAEKIPQDL